MDAPNHVAVINFGNEKYYVIKRKKNGNGFYSTFHLSKPIELTPGSLSSCFTFPMEMPNMDVEKEFELGPTIMGILRSKTGCYVINFYYSNALDYETFKYLENENASLKTKTEELSKQLANLKKDLELLSDTKKFIDQSLELANKC